VLTKALNLHPYQKLFCTTLEYGDLQPLYCGEDLPLQQIPEGTHVLQLTGIASPKQMIIDLKPYVGDIQPMTFADHHQFSKKDIRRINEQFEAMPEPKMIITTEKDNARLFGLEGLSEQVRHHIYQLPVHIKFMLGQEEEFNEKIIGYVRKNSKNSILAKAKDDNKAKDSNRAGDGSRTISFRNN
jgi:tetraacyldisaccharide 4'-kinase